MPLSHIYIPTNTSVVTHLTALPLPSLQFMQDHGDEPRRSAVTGKKIKMKVKKSSDDKKVCWLYVVAIATQV